MGKREREKSLSKQSLLWSRNFNERDRKSVKKQYDFGTGPSRAIARDRRRGSGRRLRGAACAASTAFLGEKAGCWAAFTATSLIKRGRRGPRLLAFAAALARRGALRAVPVGMTDAVLGALAASPDDRAAALECLHAFGACKVAGVGDLARQAVRALDAGAAAPAPRPRWRGAAPSGPSRSA